MKNSLPPGNIDNKCLKDYLYSHLVSEGVIQDFDGDSSPVGIFSPAWPIIDKTVKGIILRLTHNGMLPVEYGQIDGEIGSLDP